MKYLPQTTKSSFKGFTLVELLVVISIIAVLAVVALSVFGNVQRAARDARRRTEIDAIAKSLEVARNPSTQTYTYTTSGAANNLLNDFPDGLFPTDPSPTAGTYCIDIGASSTPPADAVYGIGFACPGGYATLNVANGALAASPSWKVCAKLEVTGIAFCKGSLLR